MGMTRIMFVQSGKTVSVDIIILAFLRLLLTMIKLFVLISSFH